MTAALGEPIQVTALVARAFEQAGVPYAVGGSVASSVHGEPRSTQDADILAALGLGQVDRFVDALGDGFYADAEMMRSCIRAREPFNVVHLATMFKIDVFIAGGDALAREELSRRRLVEIEGERLYVATPEDVVIQKLWYRKGNEVSERQWRDVLGVLRVQGAGLEVDYVRRWAKEGGVEDLLDRALTEARSV